jgi:predicted metalloprotease
LGILADLGAQEVEDAISAGELASFMEVMGISTDDVWTDLFHVSQCCE